MLLEIVYPVVALAAVLGAIVLGGRLLAARAPRAAATGQALRLEAVLPLDGKRRLLLVACDGRRLVLLTGGDADVVVGWLPEPLP